MSDEAIRDAVTTEPVEATPAGATTAAAVSVPSREAVLEVLKGVIDPELGINIVDLGLVYRVEIEDGMVVIDYTLTTMGCPIGPLIEQQMQALVAPLEGVRGVHPQMVIRPPWSPELMSEDAKTALGYF
jgi:metal-sulfur cluster biosynthetic enzyme